MKAATIVPQPYLSLIAEDDYHLALAHLVLEEGYEEYTAFYEKVGYDPSKFLILDNGVIEGKPQPIQKILEKAAHVHADEIVLPDVFQNRYATLANAYEAIEVFYSLGYMWSDVRLMVVPQGKDFDEWLSCAREMLKWPINTLGIPKVLVKMAGRDGRLIALQALQEELQQRPDVAIHLLGCWESPLEAKVIENAIRAKRIAPVRGIDSAIAYVYARAGMLISEGPRPSGSIDFAASDADERLLSTNIDIWRNETASLPSIGDNGSNVIRLF